MKDAAEEPYGHPALARSESDIGSASFASSHRLLRRRSGSESTADPPIEQQQQQHRNHTVEGDQLLPEPESLELPERKQPPDAAPSMANTPATRSLGPCSDLRWWALELVALLTSAAALTTLLIVLARFDSRPLLAWTYPYSLNAFVSVCSIFIRTPLAFVVGSCLGYGKWTWFTKRAGLFAAFLAFDQASRGPLGCVCLLWHWETMGAWVTIALVAVDPFLQALVLYEGRSAASDGDVAKISRASGLDAGLMMKSATFPPGGGEFGPGPYRLFPDVALSAAMLMSVVNSSLASQPQPPSLRCATGNCTWPHYSSLGICSSCFDISSQITKEAITATAPGAAAHLSPASYTRYKIAYKAHRELYFVRGDGLADWGKPEYIEPRDRLALSAVFSPRDTFNFARSETMLVAFAFLAPPQAYLNGWVPWEDAAMSGAECALEFCGHVHEARMVNGVLAETAVFGASSFGKVDGSFRPIQPPATDDQQLSGGDNSLAPLELLAYNGEGGREVELLPRYDLQLHLDLGSAGVDLSRTIQPRFNISQRAVTTMVEFLARNSTLDFMRLALAGSQNKNNITAALESAARLITYRIRELDGGTVDGAAEQWAVYVAVRWRYTAFPLAVFACGVVFAAGVVADSRRLGIGAREAGLLTMFLHGLDAESREELLRVHDAKRLRPAGIRVRLRQGDDGLYLRPEPSHNSNP
ncbi:hypothetical protein B0T24DRAFT_697218 [Lasiosphaeria ovina]|uniref:Uncharacterized protein n=1 Tax=Lasiosphaeria ovina TaxID=92902 RepID=A0AAE0NFL1_9PEZI|nr:hypothetical protein B0T24DRAFT_697218 [Lasiosphaeria ovina]